MLGVQEEESVSAPVEEQTGGESSSLPALSRMRKAELVAECDERGVSNEGPVSDLRSRLREARSADEA